MRKQDLDRDASGPAIFLSMVALILSGLAAAAYFMFKSEPQIQATTETVARENYCANTSDDQETLLQTLSDLKAAMGDEWSSFCQDRLDSILYETAVVKATAGRFNTSFMRLCQIPQRPESDYFRDAEFLFNIWTENRNTSGEPQEIKPLLTSFFQTYKNPFENCPAAQGILSEVR
ncbi:hypothetical protein [Leptolyngbya sp. Heron Island J]|uniref:hypothetical protein n=1 Tax=Leptolyngbya sp. Heron Island J TaxID=1385935 RepID=UPI0012695093|nr:hypothetical protein [Leptolyngbya sp. Heron Island J]